MGGMARSSISDDDAGSQVAQVRAGAHGHQGGHGACRISSSLKTASSGSLIPMASKRLPSASSASRPFARSSQIRSIGSGDRGAHRQHGAVLTVCLRRAHPKGCPCMAASTAADLWCRGWRRSRGPVRMSCRPSGSTTSQFRLSLHRIAGSAIGKSIK